MIKRVREDRGGFTLAELLIVVAIIAVLVAVAIPVFTNASDSAVTATAQSDIRGVTASAATTALLDKVTIPDGGSVLYQGTVDRSGHVTDVKKVDSGTVTTEDQVKTWLQGDNATLDIIVEIKDVAATS